MKSIIDLELERERVSFLIQKRKLIDTLIDRYIDDMTVSIETPYRTCALCTIDISLTIEKEKIEKIMEEI